MACPTRVLRHLAAIGLATALLGACSSGGDGSPDGDAGATPPTGSETDPGSSAAETATTTTTEPVDLEAIAFPAIPGFQYALLPTEAVDFFAASLEAEPGDPLVEAAGARVVQQDDRSVGVLVAYLFGEELDEVRARDAFVAGVGFRAAVEPEAIELGSRPMYRIVDSETDTVGLLWWEDDGLAFLALARTQPDVEEIAAARIAAE